MRRAALGLLLFGACATSATPPANPPSNVDEVQLKAQALGDAAREAEPAVTKMLVALAEEKDGSMYKLKYRLKTYESTVRKLRLKQHAAPGKPLEEIVIEDTLRYTMRFDDIPDGHYIASVQAVLQSLENSGHSVKRIKNYWPADDNYSGLNCVLKTPSGLPWELQFHTSESIAVQTTTRPLYEELRKIDTPLERKRKLFDEMTAAWNTVKIPFEVLVPKNLHQTEEIRTRDRP